MAAVAGTVWEFRATAGASNNGGGFDTASGGTDYSNQDDPELSFSTGELSTAGSGSTALTDDMMGGLFTSNMVGNYIYLETGMNLVDGRYRITAFTDSDNVTLDRAPDDGGGGVSGSDGYVGGAIDKITDAFIDDTNIVTPGNKFHIKNDGTMTISASIATSRDGTDLLPYEFIGYNTTREDDPTATSRPLIACGANSFTVDKFWMLSHIRFTTTNAYGIVTGGYCKLVNCKSNNSSGTATRNAFSSNSSDRYIQCEAESVNGCGFSVGGSSVRLLHCYAHDSADGIRVGNLASNVTIVDCIIYNNTTGIHVPSGNVRNGFVKGNTLNTNTTQIYIDSSYSGGWIIEDNILDAGTDGLELEEAHLTHYVDYNVWDNTTDVTNISKGPNAVTGDPQLTDPSSGDFTLDSSSNAIDAGSKITVPGITV